MHTLATCRWTFAINIELNQVLLRFAQSISSQIYLLHLITILIFPNLHSTLFSWFTNEEKCSICLGDTVSFLISIRENTEHVEGIISTFKEAGTTWILKWVRGLQNRPAYWSYHPAKKSRAWLRSYCVHLKTPNLIEKMELRSFSVICNIFNQYVVKSCLLRSFAAYLSSESTLKHFTINDKQHKLFYVIDAIISLLSFALSQFGWP